MPITQLVHSLITYQSITPAIRHFEVNICQYKSDYALSTGSPSPLVACIVTTIWNGLFEPLLARYYALSSHPIIQIPRNIYQLNYWALPAACLDYLAFIQQSRTNSVLFDLHMAPSCFNTVFTVLSNIFISRPILQLLIYSVSSFTTSSKSVICDRPLTCHIPVRPGFVARRAL